MTELVKKPGQWSFRAGATLAAATGLFLAWANLAVGIAGDEDNPVNLSFFVMLAAACVGAFAAEFRSRGLARAMIGVAGIQMLLGVIVATGPVALREPNGPMMLLVLNGVFAMLWLCAAMLFSSAARAGRD